jgi:hypothetical protein
MSMNNDEMERYKNMMYSWDKERQYILEAQKCQRNWSFSKTIHPTARDHLLWIAQNAPSKQHEAYYDVFWSDDRKVLQELSEYTWGNTHTRTPPSNVKNSQQNASLYILFVAKEPETQLNCNADGTLKENGHHERWLNAYMSVGIAMGLVLQSANKMGLVTGCNKSHNDINGNDYWPKRLGILDEVSKGTKLITYGIGIGFSKKGKERYESDQTDIMIGAANGSRTTTTGMEKHPRTGLPLRKVKIIDIKKNAGKVIEDDYGDYHTIPSKVTTKINTPRLRNIKVTEIK